MSASSGPTTDGFAPPVSTGPATVSTGPATVMTGPAASVLTRTAALAAAAGLLAEAVVAIIAPAAVDDHSQGLGRLSEALVGGAFLAGAIAQWPLRPAGRFSRVLWLLAPAGLALCGLTMMSVVVTTSEPATWLFTLGTVPMLVGTVAAGIIGIRTRVWAWWVGAGLALLLPVMFLMPFNSLMMGAIWLAVAFTARRPARATAS